MIGYGRCIYVVNFLTSEILFQSVVIPSSADSRRNVLTRLCRIPSASTTTSSATPIVEGESVKRIRFGFGTSRGDVGIGVVECVGVGVGPMQVRLHLDVLRCGKGPVESLKWIDGGMDIANCGLLIFGTRIGLLGMCWCGPENADGGGGGGDSSSGSGSGFGAVKIRPCEIRFGSQMAQQSGFGFSGCVNVLATGAMRSEASPVEEQDGFILIRVEPDSFPPRNRRRSRRRLSPSSAYIIQYRRRLGLVVVRTVMPIDDVLTSSLRDASTQVRRAEDLANAGIGIGEQPGMDFGRIPSSVSASARWSVDSCFEFGGPVGEDRRLVVILQCPRGGGGGGGCQLLVAEASVRDLCFCPLSMDDDDLVTTTSASVPAENVGFWVTEIGEEEESEQEQEFRGRSRRRSFVAGSIEADLPPAVVSSSWRMDPGIGNESLFRVYMVLNSDGLHLDQEIIASGALPPPSITSSTSECLSQVEFVALTNTGLHIRLLLRSTRQCLLDRFENFARNMDLTAPPLVYGMQELCSRAGLGLGSLDDTVGSTDVEDDGIMDVDATSNRALDDVLNALWRCGYARAIADYVVRRRGGERILSSPFVFPNPSPVFYWVQSCVEENSRIDLDLVDSLLRRDMQASTRPDLAIVVRNEVSRLRRDRALIRDLIPILAALRSRAPAEGRAPKDCDRLSRKASALFEYFGFALWMIDSGFNRSFRPTRVPRSDAPPMFLSEVVSVPPDMSTARTRNVPVPRIADLLWSLSEDQLSYPPGSPKEILEFCYTVPQPTRTTADMDLLFRRKRATVFFYLLDYVLFGAEEEQDSALQPQTQGIPRISNEDENASYLKSFSESFQISDDLEQFVFGVWALSRLGGSNEDDDRLPLKHGDIRRLCTASSLGISSLLEIVVRTLLLRQTERAYRTAKILLRTLGSLESLVLEMMVQVSSQDYRAAVLCVEKEDGETRRILLYILLERLSELGCLNLMFGFPIDAETEGLFVSFLKTHDQWDVLRRFYVNRSRFVEAMSVSQMMSNDLESRRLRSVIPTLVLTLAQGSSGDAEMTLEEDPSASSLAMTPESGDPHDVRQRLSAAISSVEDRVRYPPRSVEKKHWTRSCFGQPDDYRLWGLRRHRKRKRSPDDVPEPRVAPRSAETTGRSFPKPKKRKLNEDAQRDQAMDVGDDDDVPVAPPSLGSYDDDDQGRFRLPSMASMQQPDARRVGTIAEPISIDSSSSEEEEQDADMGQSRDDEEEDEDGDAQMDDYGVPDYGYQPFTGDYDPGGSIW